MLAWPISGGGQTERKEDGGGSRILSPTMLKEGWRGWGRERGNEMVERKEMAAGLRSRDREKNIFFVGMKFCRFCFCFEKIKDLSSDAKIMENQRDSLPRVSHPKHIGYKAYQK